jgi:hypothetical protein
MAASLRGGLSDLLDRAVNGPRGSRRLRIFSLIHVLDGPEHWVLQKQIN